MLLHRPLTVGGKVIGTIFTLEYEGDVFPEHTHTDKDNHVSILAHGSVKLLGKYKDKVLTATPGGLIVDWVAGEPHGFIALTNGATLINILKDANSYGHIEKPQT